MATLFMNPKHKSWKSKEEVSRTVDNFTREYFKKQTFDIILEHLRHKTATTDITSQFKFSKLIVKSPF